MAKESSSQPGCSPYSAMSGLVRAARVYSCATRVFLSYRLARGKDEKLKSKLGISGDPDADDHPEMLAFWEEVHVANAERIYDTILDLRGLWVKVGQYMSSRADIVPIPYVKKLSGLQDSVPTHPWQELDQTLCEDLGPDWRKGFESIDEDALSSASVAQVHKAVLEGGEEVVLKVQHRGVGQQMRSDLENLSTLTRIIAWLEPDWDFQKIVDEWKPAVKQELDMRLEADALKEVAVNMKAAGVEAIVPKPYEKYLTERVLVMEFCHGFSVRDTEAMDRHGVDRNLLMHRICHAFAVQMHVNGFFNADPHPGNLLVSTNKTQNGNDASVPVLLDFGLTKRFTKHMLLAFARMMHATYSMDVDELVAAFKAMELKLAVDDPLEDLANMRKVFQAVPREKAQEMRKQMKAEREAKMASHPNPKKPVESWPAELVFFFRVTGLLRGLASSLDLEYPYLKTMATAALETIRNATPPAERACSFLYTVPSEPSESSQIETLTDTLLQSKLEAAVSMMHSHDMLQHQIVGMQVSVYHRGERVANIAAGTLGVADPRPVTFETLFNVFSVTKGVASAALLLLKQQGELDLEAKVSDYWPEFSSSGKGECTVQQLLNHQAGLADALPEVATLADLTDFDKMVDFLASHEPAHEPGAETHYHYLTFGWLVGALAHRASGSPLTSIIRDQIAAPMGIQDALHVGIPKDMPPSRLATLNNGFKDDLEALTANNAHGAEASGLFGGPAQQKAAMMHSSSTGTLPNPNLGSPAMSGGSVHEEDDGDGGSSSEEGSPRKGSQPSKPQLQAVWARFKGKEHLLNPTTFNMRQVREAVIPAANGHFSAHALARFYAGLVGSVDGEGPLLTPETIEQCIASATEKGGGKPGGAADDPMLAQHQAMFGLGFQVHTLKDATTGETVHSLGHSGVGGSHAFAIPKREISFAITVNNLTGSRVVPNLVCALVCEELGVVPPVAMLGNAYELLKEIMQRKEDTEATAVTSETRVT